MHPVLYQSGDFVVGAYGPVYLVAFLASIAVFALLGRRFTGLTFGKLVDLGFQMAIAGEIGARVVFVIVEIDRFVEGAIGFREFLVAGRVVLGGIVAGVAYGVWIFRRYKLPVGSTLDATLIAAALGMGLGRFACLLGGCCFGKPTDLAWGITFTEPMAQRLNGTPLHVALHPTQWILAVLGLATFGLLLWLHLSGAKPGRVVLWFFLLSGATRFAVEFLRGDPRGEGAGLATSQWIGLGMIVVAVVGFVWMRVREARAERAA